MIYGLIVPGSFDEVTEMRVLEWHGQPGQDIAPGQLVVELETHKVVVEVRAGAHAILREILCAAGGWQKAGAPIAFLSDRPDEPLPASAEGLDQPVVMLEIV
jgi:pyruvate/2-oxoglutarate dehydrogenase complex dihydrolipoamide acyltransferase (E2) component